ncbi:hypothetical protein BD779DRAFT_1492528 [Infundibulicybe gibba]|nr:hypothetical protein BD779DRAFT_1492528 [Infundibulicybe gibba]
MLVHVEKKKPKHTRQGTTKKEMSKWSLPATTCGARRLPEILELFLTAEFVSGNGKTIRKTHRPH